MPVRWSEVTKLERAARQAAGQACLLGEAAEEAGVTTLELMAFMSESGYRSPYSWEDFVGGTEELDNFLDYRPPSNRSG